MTPFNALLAALVVYVPYQEHYQVLLPMRGLNLINMLFLAALLAVLLRKGTTRSPTPLKRSMLFFIAMLAWGFLVGQLYDSSRLAEDVTWLKNCIFPFLLYFLFFHAVRDIQTVRLLFATLLGVTFLVSLQCVRQAFDYGFASFEHTHRAAGPFAKDYTGANKAAAYFAIFTPLYLAVFMGLKSRPIARLLALPGIAFGIAGMLFTFSRQGYFILAGIFTIQAVRRSLAFGVVLVLAVATYEVWAPESVIERIQMTSSEEEARPARPGAAPPAADGGGDDRMDKSTASRFVLWEGAMHMLASRPWGTGLAHFPRNIGQYAPEYARMDAHNGFVLVGAELGVLGFVAMAWLLFGLLRLARKVEKLDGAEESRVLGSGFFAAVVAAGAVNLFGSRFLEGTVMGNFWILAALVARYYTLVLEGRPAPRPVPAGVPAAA
jgi:hypothetical protein